jgi:hypothetical protein
MIAAVCGAPCAMQRRTESGLQARPLFFNYLRTATAHEFLIQAKSDGGLTLSISAFKRKFL